MGLPGTEAALCAPPRLGGSSSLPDPVSRAALSSPARQVRGRAGPARGAPSGGMRRLPRGERSDGAREEEVVVK